MTVKSLCDVQKARIINHYNTGMQQKDLASAYSTSPSTTKNTKGTHMKITIVVFSLKNDDYPNRSPDELINHWEAYDHPSHATQRYEELLKRDDLHMASICSVLRSTDYEPWQDETLKDPK